MQVATPWVATCFFYPHLVMNTEYLLVLAVLAALCLFFARRKKKDGANLFKEVTMSPSSRFIRVYDMNEDQLKKAVDDYHDYADADEAFTITREGENQFLLTFAPTMDYVSFCYWVNFLVYPDEESKVRFKVYGWYPFGEAVQNDVPLPFNNQTVMVYVEPDDKTGDNVSLVTPEGDHYLQPFAINGNLALHPAGTESYRPCPIHQA